MKLSLTLAIVLILGCLSTSLATEANTKRCKALVLQSGGDLGSYEVGALRGLYESLP
jgi:hypothetical protein